jgi:hypothetical protein
MPRSAALPFSLRRSSDVIAAGTITSTTETVHGLLRLDEDRLVVQWRVSRKIDFIGGEIRTDEELKAVREATLPLAAVAGAAVRRPWWGLAASPRLVLTAADLRAFEPLTGPDGLGLAHPAELVLRLRRGDRLPAEEFAAELALALAQQVLPEGGSGAAPLPGRDPAPAPRGKLVPPPPREGPR